MQLPFERQHAGKMTRHHLLFERPQWEAVPKAKTVSQLGAFVVGVNRAPHDYLHTIIKPVPVPSIPVLRLLEDVGHANQLWVSDADRIDHILDDLVGFAKFTRSTQQSHEVIEVAASLEAQMAIIGFMKAIKPHYE